MSRRRVLGRIEDWTARAPLFVLGPTGTGKTALALAEVQRRFPDRLKWPLLISLDSVAVYRGLDIGSSKPLGVEREPYDWAALDWVDVQNRVSAFDYVEHVTPLLRQARSADRPVLIVGGSHFYEKALVDGMSPGGPSDPAFINQLSQMGGAELKRRLVEVDVRWNSKVHENDRYRLHRFSDLTLRQGLSFDDLFGAERIGGLPEVELVVVGMDLKAVELDQRLSLRIDGMFASGWLEEVDRLLAAGVPPDAPGLQTVGYREVTDYLLSGRSGPIEDLKTRILESHRQLVKKQKTWLRGLLRGLDQSPA